MSQGHQNWMCKARSGYDYADTERNPNFFFKNHLIFFYEGRKLIHYISDLLQFKLPHAFLLGQYRPRHSPWPKQIWAPSCFSKPMSKNVGRMLLMHICIQKCVLRVFAGQEVWEEDNISPNMTTEPNKAFPNTNCHSHTKQKQTAEASFSNEA